MVVVGLTVSYRATCADPTIEIERQTLSENVAKWTCSLDESTEAYSWNIRENGRLLVGFTKIPYGAYSERDYANLVRAVQELERLLPRFAFLVRDGDIVIEDTPPHLIRP